MKIKHNHPTYADEKERLSRLLELKKTCAAKLGAARSSGGDA